MFLIPVPDTPVEVMVDLLTKAKDMAASCSSAPEELSAHLQKALDIASGLDKYLEEMTTRESEPLRELYEYAVLSFSTILQFEMIFDSLLPFFLIERRCLMTGMECTRRARHSSNFQRNASLDMLRVGLSPVLIGQLWIVLVVLIQFCLRVPAGQTLKMLIHMSRAKRVLEIGMFTGYGALSMAEGLPDDGLLVACELEPYLKEFAQPVFDKSPHGKKIVVKTGSAMDTLKAR